MICITGGILAKRLRFGNPFVLAGQVEIWFDGQMRILILCIGLAFGLEASGQNVTRVTTLIASAQRTNDLGQVVFGAATNTLFLPLGEAARVSTLQHSSLGFPAANFAQFWYVRDGWYWPAEKGAVIAGPATFVIWLAADADSAGLLTIERWKVLKK